MKIRLSPFIALALIITTFAHAVDCVESDENTIFRKIKKLRPRPNKPQKGTWVDTYSREVVGLCKRAAAHEVGDARTEQSYVKALELYQKAAAHDSALAHYKLAKFYENGLGTAPNFTQAIRHYECSAENGFAQAQYILGSYYADGVKVQQDPVKAFDLLTRAAEQDQPNALYYLGFLYEKGIGTEKNSLLAVDHYLRAAASDIPGAMLRASLLIARGIGAQQNRESAQKLLSQSLQKLEVPSIDLALIYAHGVNGAQHYLPLKQTFAQALRDYPDQAPFLLGLLHGYHFCTNDEGVKLLIDAHGQNSTLSFSEKDIAYFLQNLK